MGSVQFESVAEDLSIVDYEFKKDVIMSLPFDTFNMVLPLCL